MTVALTHTSLCVLSFTPSGVCLSCVQLCHQHVAATKLHRCVSWWFVCDMTWGLDACSTVLLMCLCVFLGWWLLLCCLQNSSAGLIWWVCSMQQRNVGWLRIGPTEQAVCNLFPPNAHKCPRSSKRQAAQQHFKDTTADLSASVVKASTQLLPGHSVHESLESAAVSKTPKHTKTSHSKRWRATTTVFRKHHHCRSSPKPNPSSCAFF